ncbi:hypothetical protein ASD86_24345 [Lysobacter sp. Root690]|nr:hypothetical protein ASD86_24345 [Lysobacter sp. Root690]
MATARAPVVIGVRHHSPACARLVAACIRALRPRHVLIEGPADFNPRIDELHLPHRLPLAIYSYLSHGPLHRGSWSPFAEHSPEWQALSVAREVGAQARFIDLPAWHEAFAELPNRYADEADAQAHDRAEAYEDELSRRLSIDGRDALWDHLFEDAPHDLDGPDEALAQRLHTYFEHLRHDDPGSPGNAAREEMMARWIAWAMAREDGPVLVVCGGYHAPALARMWREVDVETFGRDDDGLRCPATPVPELDLADDAQDQSASAQAPPLRYGSFLVPYGFKRLDAFTGYASGMSSPAFYQWVWESGMAQAGLRMLQRVLARLRGKHLPASTADFVAVHTHAQALARLRGHADPLRSDWLDAIAGALVKDALDAPLPWSYRGPIRAGTDPVLMQVMDVIAGDAVGLLAPGTPQPPLLASVQAELTAHGLTFDGERRLDLLDSADRARSRVLHRLLLLQIPGIERRQGPRLSMSGERRELWQLRAPLEQQAALIEAGAYGATLLDAARARLEERLRAAQGRVEPLAQALDAAAFAGLAEVSDGLLRDLRAAIGAEPRLEAIGAALELIHALWRHGDLLDISGAPVLAATIEAGFDRALWLLEPAASIVAADAGPHLRTIAVLRDIVRDALADADVDNDTDTDTPRRGPRLQIEPARALAVLRRKALDPQADPLGRGAALGALFDLHAGRGGQEPDDIAQALHLLGALAPARLGDALTGLVSLARERLTQEREFVSGLDRLIGALDDADFVLALPAMRGAFAWLPPRERGELAHSVLRLHGADHLSQRALTATLAADPAQVAAAARIEAQVLQRLREWGLDAIADEEAAQ